MFIISPCRQFSPLSLPLQQTRTYQIRVSYPFRRQVSFYGPT